MSEVTVLERLLLKFRQVSMFCCERNEGRGESLQSAVTENAESAHGGHST